MSNNTNIITKKIRTEYMKKFRDPKWETFSKCYEDSVKYRRTRRVMEQTHKPLFWDGWDSGSDSSGRSSPKIRDGVESSDVRPHSSTESKNENPEPPQTWEPQINGELHSEATVLENSVPIVNGATDLTDNGPCELVPRRRHRRRAPRSEPCYPDADSDESKASLQRKPSRAKSQPPASAKERPSTRENRRSFMHYDWAERQSQATSKRTPNMRASVSAGEIHRSDVGVQTRRESDKRGKALDRRRARSADLEKSRKSDLTVVNDRWMTEYMRCFSARLR
ncbi:centriole, cilia and spindle-associated protein [Chanos chanos]|uniref:Centriole, cilia and spindle-associated protein n=1 Tax=Chanos chanos TaxID=29144 RepID=A0A6J2VXM9_CHACN|nr:centriole, cilia and spindle-associated protein-like [Chanos chanos]